MKFNTFLLTIAAALLAFSVGVAQAPDAVERLFHSESAPREAFSQATASGYIKYDASYNASEAQPLLVYIALRSPARLYRMNYEDFKFTLRDQTDRRIPNEPQSFHFGGMPSVGAVQLAGGSNYEGMRCAFGPRQDAFFPFRLDELYPNLKSGTYILQITFRPRDGSVPATILPPVTFTIQ
jgi:hypothetical protein